MSFEIQLTEIEKVPMHPSSFSLQTSDPGQIKIGDTFKDPKFRNKQGKLRTFDRVVAPLESCLAA